MNGTITPAVKKACVAEHADIIPHAGEVADHIDRVSAYAKSVERIALAVLGRKRVEAGLKGIGHEPY
jgi:hypothetical protein